MGRYTSGGIARDVIAGALAGAASVWVIEKMQLSTTHAAVTPDQPAGVDPAHALAAKAAERSGADIGPEHDNALGHTLHYAAGAGLGALYGLLRGMSPSVATGRGALYGFVTYLIGDEVGMPALGLAKGPLHYPMRDHARGALGHTLFGIFTDLGTRLMAPWRDEVVVLRGPTLGERIEAGRGMLEDGRSYLDERGRRTIAQGREVVRRGRDTLADAADGASDYIDAGRKRARGLVERVREYLPDPDDVYDTIDRGRRYAAQFAGEVRSRLPDADDVGETVGRGRDRARRFAGNVRSRLPDADDVSDTLDRGRRRAGRFADDVRSRLPERDDVDDVVDRGRKQGQRWSKRVRDRLPDSDDAQDALDRGQKRVRDLAGSARDAAEQAGGTPVKRFLHWLVG